MSDEHETELDKAIASTIAIALLDGPHKRDRLEKSIVRLLTAAAADGGEHLRREHIHEARAAIRNATHAVAVYRPGGDVLELGERRWERAVERWAACLETGSWPDYSATAGDRYPWITLPPWLLRQEEERDE